MKHRGSSTRKMDARDRHNGRTGKRTNRQSDVFLLRHFVSYSAFDTNDDSDNENCEGVEYTDGGGCGVRRRRILRWNSSSLNRNDDL